MTTVGAILARAERALSSRGLPPGDAVPLLAHATGMRTEDVFAHPEHELSRGEEKLFEQLLQKRTAGYSVAVVVGYKYFCGLRFLVSEHTLIPRPESELIVERAISFLKNRAGAAVLDMGTGSGNLIVSLASSLPRDRGHRYCAADISPEALDIARRNARSNGQDITFIESDLFSAVPPRSFDLIIANLPYLSSGRMAEPSIAREPIGALWGGPDGLSIYRRFFGGVARVLLPAGRIILEMNPDQNEELTRIARASLTGSRASSADDLAGQKRVLVIQRQALHSVRNRGKAPPAPR